jgi:hypothetical protein
MAAAGSSLQAVVARLLLLHGSVLTLLAVLHLLLLSCAKLC